MNIWFVAALLLAYVLMTGYWFTVFIHYHPTMPGRALLAAMMWPVMLPFTLLMRYMK